jgi:hypothetical protein
MPLTGRFSEEKEIACSSARVDRQAKLMVDPPCANEFATFSSSEQSIERLRRAQSSCVAVRSPRQETGGCA